MANGGALDQFEMFDAIQDAECMGEYKMAPTDFIEHMMDTYKKICGSREGGAPEAPPLTSARLLDAPTSFPISRSVAATKLPEQLTQAANTDGVSTLFGLCIPDQACLLIPLLGAERPWGW
jgi:hypothetical protein